MEKKWQLEIGEEIEQWSHEDPVCRNVSWLRQEVTMISFHFS